MFPSQLEFFLLLSAAATKLRRETAGERHGRTEGHSGKICHVVIVCYGPRSEIYWVNVQNMCGDHSCSDPVSTARRR